MSPPAQDSGLTPSESRWLELLTRGWREPGDLDAVLGRIAEVAREAFCADLCAVFAINPITGRFVERPGFDGELHEGDQEVLLKPPRDTGLTRRVIEHGFLAVPDVSGLPDHERGFSVKEGVASFAAVTLRTIRHDRPLAVLYVDFREPRALSDDLENDLRRFASIASRELQATWFLRRYQWIGKVAQQVNRRFASEKELFESLSNGVGRIIDTSGCLVWGLYHPETPTVDVFAGGAVTPDWPVDAALLRLLEGQPALRRPEAERAAELLESLGCLADQVPWEPGSFLFERLLHLETPLGFMAVLHPSPGTFDDEDGHLVRLLASQVTLALSNHRLLDHLERLRQAEQDHHDKVLEDLRELDRKLIGSNDLDELLQVILGIAERRLAERTPPDEASILLYDRHRDELVTRAAIGPNAEKSRGQVLPVTGGRGITLKVLRTGEPILVADTHDPEYHHLFVDVGGNTRCELDVPLKDGDEVVGVLNLESQEPGAFDDRDRHLMRTLAGQAVLAVNKTRAYEEEHGLRQEKETLIELAKELARRPDARELLEMILQKAVEKTGAQVGVLVLVDEREQTMVVKAMEGIPDEDRNRRRSLEGGILGHVVETGEPVNADLEDPRWAQVHRPVVPGMKFELAVPIKRDEALIGVLNVESPGPRAFSYRNQRLLEGLAELAVIALRNAETFEQAKRRLRRFEVLHRAGKRLARISNAEDLSAVYDEVVEIAAEQFESKVVVRRFDEDAEVLVRVADSRTEGPQVFDKIPLNDPLNGRVARERRKQVVHDADDPPPAIGEFPRSNEDDRSFAVLPVQLEERYYGNLALSHAEPNHFKDLDIQLAEGLAQQLALTLHRLEEARAYQEEKTVREIGRRSYDLMHRLGNDLVPAKVSAKKARRLLHERDISEPEIEAELEKIQADVQSVLDLSKKLASHVLKSRDQLKRYPVKQLIDDAISGLTLPEGEEDRFEIDKDIPADCGTMEVRVDHGDFMDCLLNLFRNAVDAMPDGGRLSVRATGTDDSVEIQVEDTGEGIDPDLLERIFTVGVSTRGSSGWGLYSVKQVVIQSGGEIRVHSEVGVGTTFTILLPRVREARGA